MSDQMFTQAALLIVVFWGLGFVVLSFIKAFVRPAR